MNAMLLAMLPYAVSHIVWNSLSSQHFTPPHMGIKYIREQKLLQEIRNLSLTTYGCQWKPSEFHSPVCSMTQFCYE